MNNCSCLAIIIFSLTDSSSDLHQSDDINVHLKTQLSGKEAIYMQGMSLRPFHNEGKSGAGIQTLGC